MVRRFFFILFAALLSTSAVFAQSGKIAGRVTDRETGDVLPGANVMIVGTTLGAASNVNGEFFMLSVPTGMYTIKASFIGYKELTVESVKVSSGLTTKLDFDLPTEAFVGAEVSIVAERPLVNRNATNAVRIQGSEEMKNLPVRGVQAAVALQPGVVMQNNNLFIRGGRQNDVGYYLEGANTRDREGGGSGGGLGGDNPIGVIPEALEEFQLQAGGYTAEFGGANAGIVRQTLKSGGATYHGTIQFETDDFASQGNQFLDTYSYGYRDLTTTLSGPVPGSDKMRFFVAASNVYEGDRVSRFIEGFNFQHSDTPDFENNAFPIVFSDNINDPAALALVREKGLVLQNGNVANAARNQWTGNGTLVYDAKPFIVRLGGSASWRKQDNSGFTNPISNMFNDRIQQQEVSSALVNLKATHLLGANSFYEVNLNYFDRRSVRYDPIFKHNFWAYWDSTANAAEGIQFTGFNEPWAGGTQSMDIYGFDFNAPNRPTSYGKNKRSYFGGSVAFTTQTNKHELKLGGNIERWTTRAFDVAARGLPQNARNNPDIYRAVLAAGQAGDYSAAAQGEWMGLVGDRDTYGYDSFGNEIDVDGPNGARNPIYISAYIQDKFEANDLVINAGLRVDVIDNDDFTFKDPSNPPWDRANNSLLLNQLVDHEAAIELSPRIGLAFPVTDRTVFHMQYGRFVQAPRLTDIYNGAIWFDSIFTGGTSFQTGVVGLGLDPEVTTQYEVGFGQQIGDNAAFDVTVFYKNIQDQIQIGRVQADATSRVSDYNVMINGDFATTSGLELSLTLRRTNRLAGQLNYTFSRSLGTGSVPNSSVATIELGTESVAIIAPLDFHRPQTGSLSLDYRFGKGDGGQILQQMGLNLLAVFSSGHPYTLSGGGLGQQDESYGGQIRDPRSRKPLEDLGASLTPWNFELNMRLDKTVDMGKFNANFYLYVQNLTNRKNVINVYGRTGNAYSDGFLDNASLSASVIEGQENSAPGVGGEAFRALYQAVNLNGNGVNYSRDTGNLMLANPRQIRVGARLEF